MRQETLKLLRCPNSCTNALELETLDAQKGRIITGFIHCVGCSSRFPIEEGILRMMPKHLHDQQVTPAHDEATRKQKMEMAARDNEADDYDKMKNLRLFGKVEIPYTLKQMKLRPNHVLLEAGCGTGRMTRIFAPKCKSIIAVDFSIESLRRCQRKLERDGTKNVDLIQADNCALPILSEVFDVAVSCGVLEHVPTHNGRAMMVSEMARTSKPRSTVVISAYKHSLYTRLFGSKEGEHRTGIYYFRFHKPELHKLLSEHLDVDGVSGVLMYYFTARCKRRTHPGRNH